jgi:hypothetical protein
MLPREKGGVVDPTFKVYGTSNLRVVDLGVIPLQLACHTQSPFSPSTPVLSTDIIAAGVVYAIAEKGAHIKLIVKPG